MKKAILLCFMLFGFCSMNVNAQSISNEQIKIVENTTDNLQLQIVNVDANLSESKIGLSKVNNKQGFQAEVNYDNNTLLLTISQKYNVEELITLFEYTGLKLDEKEAHSLKSLLDN